MTSSEQTLLVREYQEINTYLRTNTTQFINWFSFFLISSLVAAVAFLVTSEHRPGLKGLAPRQPYVLALSTKPDGSGLLQPLTTFVTNPAGAAIVNAIGPIRQSSRAISPREAVSGHPAGYAGQAWRASAGAGRELNRYRVIEARLSLVEAKLQPLADRPTARQARTARSWTPAQRSWPIHPYAERAIVAGK